MKKRLLSWLLVLVMIFSLIPSTLVSAWAADLVSPQAVTTVNGKTIYTMVNELPTNSHLSSYDVVDVRLSEDKVPGGKITVPNGKTLILHGTGGISGGLRADTIIVVENGGHLVLDEVLIQRNTVGSDGAIYVKSGGLLDLGYNDQSDRHAPSITNNTYNGSAKNLVIEDGATVRLNAEANKPIGITYAGNNPSSLPTALIEGGRYTLREGDAHANGETGITADDSTMQLYVLYDTMVIRSQAYKVLFWAPDDFHNEASGKGSGNSAHYCWSLNDVFGQSNVTQLIGTRPAANASYWDYSGYWDSYKDNYTRAPLADAGDLLQYDLIYYEKNGDFGPLLLPAPERSDVGRRNRKGMRHK